MRQGRALLPPRHQPLGRRAYLDGFRPNLIDAVKFDAADLAADPAALKVLLVVTE